MSAAERFSVATAKAPAGTPNGAVASPYPAISSPIAAGGTQAPLQPDFPPAPSNNDSGNTYGFERMGWDALRNYWSVYPYDVQRAFGSAFGWTNVAMRILKQSFARLECFAYLENTTDNQITQELTGLNHFAARLERHPYPGVMGRQQWREDLMMWLLEFGNCIIYTPIYMAQGGKKKAFDIAKEKLFYHHYAQEIKKTGSLKVVRQNGQQYAEDMEEKDCYAMDIRRAATAKETGNSDLIGMPASLNILETPQVWIVIDPLETVNKYTYMTRAGIRYYEPWEIMHIKTLMPNNDPLLHVLWGSSIVEHAWQSIAASMSLTSYMQNTFDNMFLPPLIAKKTAGGEWNKTEKEAFDFSWKYNQKAGQGGIAYIGEHAEVTPIDVSTNFEKLPAASKAMALEVFAQFGLNFGTVFGEHQNKSTADANVDMFYNTPLQSFVNTIDEAKTSHYQRYEQGVKMLTTPPQTKNVELELKRTTGLFQSGLLTLGQAIEEAGYDADGVENPDMRVLPTTVQTLENAQVPKPQPGATPQAGAVPKENEPAKTIKGFVDDGHGINAADKNYALFKSLDTTRGKHAAKIERTISAAFKSLEKKVLAKLDKNVKADVVNWIDVPFDKDVFADELGKALIDGDIAGLIAETIHTQAEDLNAPPETSWEKTRTAAAEQSIDNIKVSSNTAFDEIKDLLRAHKDKPVDDIKSALKDKFDTLEDSRASAIAQTTATSTMGFTSKSVHAKLGYDSQWMELYKSAEPRPTHIAANGQICDANGYFMIGGHKLLYPGDPDSVPEEVIHCKCQIKGVRKKA